MSPRRMRLDAYLVSQGLFATVDDAMRAVLAGEVSTSDRRLTSPGEQVRPGMTIHVRGRAPYVSRGGLKLEHGLKELGVDPSGLACVDVGCSTGGFTDCLLRHGASRVLSVDVGRAQFDWSLRQDRRVTPGAHQHRRRARPARAGGRLPARRVRRVVHLGHHHPACDHPPPRPPGHLPHARQAAVRGSEGAGGRGRRRGTSRSASPRSPACRRRWRRPASCLAARA